MKKILFSSTSVAYGAAKGKTFSEKQASFPLTPYAISKYACELYLNFYKSTYNIPFVAFRVANIYGPRQDGSKEAGAIAIFTSKLLKGEIPFMNNDGQTVRDYIYVDDVVSAFMAAMLSDVSGVFNLGTGKGTTTQKIWELVSTAMKSTVTPIVRPDVQDAVKQVILKNTLTKETFGWKPATSLKRGIKATVKWYKKNA